MAVLMINGANPDAPLPTLDTLRGLGHLLATLKGASRAHVSREFGRIAMNPQSEKSSCRKSYLLQALIGAFAVLLDVASAQADTVLPPFGGPGGGAFTARCAQDKFLTGFALRTGDDVDAIRPLCVRMLGRSVAGMIDVFPRQFGGTGGGPRELVCPIEAPLVTGMRIEVDGEATRIVNGIQLFCGTTIGPAMIPSPSFEGPVAGRPSWDERRCPAGQVAAGIDGRSGIWLDAVGLVCDQPKITVPPTIADATLPSIGGSGGVAFVAPCPQGQLLGGVDLRTGDWVDAIAPLCIKDAAGRPNTQPPMHGGSGGGPRQLVCPNEAPIVTGMYIQFGGQHMITVENIHLYCGTKEVRHGLPAVAFDSPPFASYYGGGPYGSVEDATESCPENQVAIGLNGRSGDFLDAVGLLCGKPAVSLGRVHTPNSSPPQDICVAARSARAHHSPAAAGLERQCLAKGGTL